MSEVNNHCECKIVDRDLDESERDWLKRCMCMFHWMQTDYYRAKSKLTEPRTAAGSLD
jgi:hypothetical protein